VLYWPLFGSITAIIIIIIIIIIVIIIIIITIIIIIIIIICLTSRYHIVKLVLSLLCAGN